MDEQDSPSSQLYPYLDPSFLELMNDVFDYGHEKYGLQSFQYQVTRSSELRWSSEHLIAHSIMHATEYALQVPHDHFGTRRHQLAAIACNAMMEWYFSRNEE